MEIKYTKLFLSKLEDVFSESGYILRYEKGNFKSGYCILMDSKVVIVNKFYPLEGKISCLIDILDEIPLSSESLSEASRSLIKKLKNSTKENGIQTKETIGK